MKHFAVMGLCLMLLCGSARLSLAGEGGKDLLCIPTDAARPFVDWPWAIGCFAADFPLYGLFVYPFAVVDYIVYPPSYYWDYGTGDFWLARRRRPIAPPEVRPLPAMPRKLKDSEQPRLLPDSLRPDAPR